MTTDAGSIDDYRDACSGQPYRALVELYAVRHDAAALAAQIRTIRGDFPPGEGRRAEGLYNVWNREGQRDDVLDLDCADALDRVVADARRRMPGDPPDRRLVLAFRLVTLGLALTASLFPDSRRRMGIQTARELEAGSSGPEG